MRVKLRKLQLARRLVQLSVLALALAIPTVARYMNYLSARELDRKIERWSGTLQATALEAIDATFRFLPGGEKERAGQTARDRERVLSYAQQLRGGPWSVDIAGVSMTDPLAGAESLAASKRSSKVLWIGLIIPLLAVLLLGRVFCSWICPMHLFLELTDKLRRLLRFLELRPQDVHFSRGTKYLLLAVGLGMAAFLSVPVLGSIYPPAIIGRELHDLVSGLFDRAEAGRFGFWAGGLTWMSLIVLGIALFEITISRRWWCRYVCPGGALYSLLGSLRPVRVKLVASKCTYCNACVEVCPIGLDPMNDRMGIECDNCGLCISHCGDDALDYTVTLHPGRRSGGIRAPERQSATRAPGTAARSLIIGLLLSVACVAGASGHHILGIPHYAYDERYPQVPILTYLVQAGPLEVRMTGYPGKPEPGTQCALSVYIQRPESGEPFDGEVVLTVMRDRMIGSDPIVYGPISARLEDAVYKFYPRFPEESNYTVRISFTADDAPWTIDLPMVVGEPGSPWIVLGSLGVGLLIFLIVIRAMRIKMRRKMSGRFGAS